MYMNEKLYKKNTLYIHIFSIAVIIILCCINIRKLDYIAVLNDEFGYWGNAVSLLGYDWKELMAETPYYSWGYSIFLLPIIRFLPTPELWYKAAIGMNLVFLICSYLLCCSVAKRLFADIESKYIYLLSLLVIIYPSNILYAQIAWSETLLYFLMWVVVYFLVRLEEEWSYWFLGIELFCLIFMYAVHARSIGIILVGFLSLFFLMLKHKKPALILLSLVIMVMGYFAVSGIKEIFLNEFWANSEMSDINNVALDKGTISMYLERIVHDLKWLIESLGGKTIYLFVGTGLTLPIAFLCCGKEMIQSIKQRKIVMRYWVTKFFSCFSFFAMWGLCSLQMLAWPARKDIIVYSRYMENALGPILLLSFLYMLRNKREIRVGTMVALFVSVLFMRNIYYRISEAEGSFNTVCSPVFGAFYDMFDGDVRTACITILIYIIVLGWIIMITTFIENEKSRIYIVVATFAVCFSVIGYKSSPYMNDARNYFDNSTVQVRGVIEDITNEKGIYYVKTEESDPYSVNPKYLQFLIPNQSIELVDNENIDSVVEKDNIILTDPRDTETNSYLITIEKVELVKTTDLLNVYIYK